MTTTNTARWWRVGAGLVLSGAALACLVLLEGRPAQAAEPGDAERAALYKYDMPKRNGASLLKKARRAQKQAAHVQDTAPAPTASRTDAAAPTRTALWTGLTAPDFVGMRLPAARKQAKALGIKLSVRDEYGERVPGDVAYQYTVRKQDVTAGSAVTAGTTVTLRARMRAAYAMGY